MHKESSDVTVVQPLEGVRVPAWYCLRSQPKHEQIAAMQLDQYEDVEVFNPRIRFSRPTKHGPVTVTESLFPNYLFARFDWHTGLAKVRYGRGVSSVVHFGDRWPTIPNEAIERLRELMGEESLKVIPQHLEPGDEVDISGGVFDGLEAVISQVMPAQQRVLVLLHFLGRISEVEVESGFVAKRQ